MFCKKEDKEVVKDREMREIDDSHVELNSSHPSSYPVWIPWAKDVPHKYRMKTRGEYRKGFPEGLVIHWTAGWHLKRDHWLKPFPMRNIKDPKLEKMAEEYAYRTCNSGKKNGFNFLVMDVFGNVYQSRPLNKWGYHAGKSFHESVGYSCSKYFAGVEVLNPGRLTEKNGKFYTWFDYEIPEAHVRHVDGSDSRPRGYYCMFTKEQEDGLLALSLWLLRNSPKDCFKLANIVGHDTISPGRKTDPGGSLSMTIEGFRDYVEDSL